MAADIYMLKTKTEQISVHFQFSSPKSPLNVGKY